VTNIQGWYCIKKIISKANLLAMIWELDRGNSFRKATKSTQRFELSNFLVL